MSGFPICFQTIALGASYPYYKAAYRVRRFGRLPWTRPATLVLCNHQHDLDTTIPIAQMQLDGPWRRPIYAAASRRMFDPGFFATRIAWANAILRRFNATALFQALGLCPIENELRERALARYALGVYERHGDVPLEKVFRADVLAQLGPEASRSTVGGLFGQRWFMQASEMRLPIRVLLEPYRSELIAEIRSNLEPDFRGLEDVLRNGNTLFLTPEGHYSRDGRMLRLQAALDRLRPLAQSLYLLAITYDPFVRGRFSMLFRILPPPDPDDLETSMRATRPIVVSQLLGAWLSEQEGVPFVRDAARAAVREWLAGLPSGAFVDPDLLRMPERATDAALDGLTRLGVLRARDGEYELTATRRHPQFPLVEDIVGFQARFVGETVGALERLAGRRS